MPGGELRRLAADGVTIEAITADGLRPGDQIVLPTDRGLMDEYGWNPSCSDPVVDASLHDAGLPVDTDAIKRLCGLDAGHLVATALGFAEDADEVEAADREQAVEEILATVRNAPAPAGWCEGEWRRYTQSLTPRLRQPRNEVARLPVRRPATEPRSDDFDEFSLGPAAVELDRHGAAVGKRAQMVAERLGLAEDLGRVVGLAATLHDIGKADARFQRWLKTDASDSPAADVLLAKSSTPRHLWEAKRVAAGWPRGGRHEDLSARLVRAWLARNSDWGTPLDRDLLVHLVISHHGKGRPLVPPAVDGTPASVHGTVAGIAVTADADLAATDWDQSGRFRRLNIQLGPWCLALLESIVIRADHAVSAGVQEAEGLDLP